MSRNASSTAIQNTNASAITILQPYEILAKSIQNLFKKHISNVNCVYNDVKISIQNPYDVFESTQYARCLLAMKVENVINFTTWATDKYVYMYKAVPRSHVDSIRTHGLLINALKSGVSKGMQHLHNADERKQFMTPYYGVAQFFNNRIDDGVILCLRLPVSEFEFIFRGTTECYVTRNVEPKYISITNQINAVIPIIEVFQLSPEMEPKTIYCSLQLHPIVPENANSRSGNGSRNSAERANSKNRSRSKITGE